MKARHQRVLLDTSVIIEPPTAGLSTLGDEMAISVVTVAELAFGIESVSDPIDQLRRRQRLESMVRAFDVLPVDADSAMLYGVLASALSAAGRSPRPRRFDLLIAATAARHQIPVATRDLDDFLHLERAVTVIEVRG